MIRICLEKSIKLYYFFLMRKADEGLSSIFYHCSFEHFVLTFLFPIRLSIVRLRSQVILMLYVPFKYIPIYVSH